MSPRRSRIGLAWIALLLSSLIAAAAAAAPAPSDSAGAPKFPASWHPPLLPGLEDSAQVAAAAAAAAAAAIKAAPPPRHQVTVPTRKPEGAEPPLNISADNVSGTRGPEGDIVLLKGDVHITRGGTVITSDRGRYLRSQGMLYLEQRVKLVDTTTTITCDQASYAEKQDLLKVEGNVVAHDGDATLRAPWATYDRRRGRLELYGGVDAKDREQAMRADSALYVRDSLLLHARGHVHGTDAKNKAELTARAVDWNRGTHIANAWGDPQLVSREDQGPATVIRAIRLEVNSDTRVARAIDSVRVVRDTLQARGEYGEFDDSTNYGILTGHPRAWDPETQVSGDTLQMFGGERHLNRVVVLHDAAVDYKGIHAPDLGEASHLTGERIDVYFTHDDIDSLVAVGKAEDRYNAPPKPGHTPETNLAQGDTITVFFLKRRIDRAKVEGHANGEYVFAVASGDTATAKQERVRYDATRIEYQVTRDHIILDPNAHLTYRDLELSARRVEFDVQHQTLVAEGHPDLIQSGDKVIGNMMTYDLSSRVGNIYKAETEYEAGIYRGDRIRKASEKELDVMDGTYTTCNLPDPHYHFDAHWMKIYLKDKVVAKPVVFYVRNVPLLALPFWIFQIKPGRHSGWLFPQFQLGVNNVAGRFFRNGGYYWAINDYMDFTLDGDYYQAEPSWVIRAEADYKVLYDLEGTVSGSYARDEAIGTEDWSFDADHTQELTPRSRLVARASFVSSRNYSTSNLFGRTLYQRFNRFLTSSVAVSHTADWASFNAFLERRQDLDADLEITAPDVPVGTRASQLSLTSSLPSISVAFPTRTIGSLSLLHGTPFAKALSQMYLSIDSRFLSYQTRQGFLEDRLVFPVDSTLESLAVVGHINRTRRGFQTDASLSDARRAFGWLNLTPHLNGSFAVFDHDVLGNKIVPTGVWSGGVTANSSFYGTFTPRFGPLEAFRHVLVPSATLNFSPKFPSLLVEGPNGITNRFTSFGGIGVSGVEQFSVALGVEQRLQVKVRHKGQIQRIDNLLAWNMSSNYDFLWDEHGLQHPLSPIGNTITLQPPHYTSGTLNFTVDPYNPRPLRNFAAYAGLNLTSSDRPTHLAPEVAIEQTPTEPLQAFHEAWNVGLTYSYSGGYTGTVPGLASATWGSNRSANAVASYQFSPNWSFDYAASYDLTLRQVGTQRFSVTRQLHCWEASFTRTFVAGGETEYYFHLGIRDQKEIYVEHGTRAGSIGGIQ